MDAGLPIITTDFKSGAREIIDPSLEFDTNINYPYYGPNGVLMCRDDFDIGLIDYSKLKQSRIGIEKFREKSILKEFKRFVG